MHDFGMPTNLWTEREADVILLDYVMTLVENTGDKDKLFDRSRPYPEWIAQERYRQWLFRLIRGKHVVMITAREEKYREPTMRRIREVLGWEPQESYFNVDGVAPPESKRRVMEKHVIPKHGRPGKVAYLALESNASTRAMYKKLGVKAVRVPTEGAWTMLPKV